MKEQSKSVSQSEKRRLMIGQGERKRTIVHCFTFALAGLPFSFSSVQFKLSKKSANGVRSNAVLATLQTVDFSDR